MPYEYFRDAISTDCNILSHDIFNAQLLFLRSLSVTETEVDSLSGFGRTFMPCLEYLCLSTSWLMQGIT